MAKKEPPKYGKELDKLMGREVEFALQLAEWIVAHPFMEDLECEFGIHPERIDAMDKDELLKRYKRLYEHIAPLYTIVHSLNKSHSCYNSHDVWRDGAIEKYKELVDSGIINDSFNLFNDDDVLELNYEDYRSVWIGEPEELSEFTTMTKDGTIYSDGDDSAARNDLVLIRSREGGNRFLLVNDFVNHTHDKIVTIDEEKLIDRITALKAKRLLTDDDDEE